MGYHLFEINVLFMLFKCISVHKLSDCVSVLACLKLPLDFVPMLFGVYVWCADSMLLTKNIVNLDMMVLDLLPKENRIVWVLKS